MKPERIRKNLRSCGLVALLFFLLLGGFDSAVAAADKIRLSISSVDMSFLTPAVSLKGAFSKRKGWTRRSFE
jgi:hypothetical protein